MRRFSTPLISKLCIVAILLTGCHPTQPFYFHEDGDLSHYVGRATQIDEPDVQVPSLADVEFAKPPLTLKNANFEDVWELTLDEAIKIALANSKVVKVLGPQTGNTQNTPLPAGSQIQSQPESFATKTMLDPALQETSIGLSGLPIGPEAALAAFDADFTANMLWQKGDNITNNNAGDQSGIIPPTFQRQDLANFNARVAKTTATGTTVGFQNQTTYEWNNNLTANAAGRAGRIFPSEYRVDFQMDIRHPLLQGRGVAYNRIAGPFSPNAGVGTRAFDGVLLARIDADRELADLEANIKSLVSDVENVYWQLYCVYQRLDVEKQGLERARDVWKKSKERDDPRYPATAEVDRAKEQYFSFLGRVEQAKTDLFNWENRLRYLLGLGVSDCRLIRPSDEPIRVDVIFDWHEILGEALSRSVELRRQKWQIERRELELIAAKNHLLPRLDMVARYRWKGFGDQLINPGTTTGRFDNAFANFLSGDFQEWELGFEFNLPIGMRQELADVRHRQLLIARDTAVLKEQELELSHQLAEAVRDLDNWSRLTRTYFNQRLAAKSEYDKLKQRFDNTTGVSNFDLLNAQARYLQSETQYRMAVCNYTRAITQIHLRKGSLLDHHNVFMAEGPWPGKAYFDAVRLARQRDASMYLNYGNTQPGVLSRGPYAQHSAPHGPYDAIPAGPYDSSGDAEELPTPQPEDSDDQQPEAPQPEAPQPGLRFTRAAAAPPQVNFRRGADSHAREQSVLASDAVGEASATSGGRAAEDAGSTANGSAASSFRR